MTRRQVWQYRCEFCGKRNLSAGHMAAHEKTCTANPDRTCRMHKHCEGEQRPVSELIAVIRAHLSGTDGAMATTELRKVACGCPACMLAAIRQSGLQQCEIDEEGIRLGVDFGFDMKRECAEFWKTVNDRIPNDEGYY